MAPTLDIAGAPKYVLLDTMKFKANTKIHEGRSPWADKVNEGPSYKQFPAPLRTSGKLEKFDSKELTPVIGREYIDIQITELLKDDELIRELAVIISERGVVFFGNQDITKEQQKEFIDKLGRLTGKPSTSTVHIHPTAPAGGFLTDDGEIDPEISIISSQLNKALYTDKDIKPADSDWHSDVTFEPVPADYTVLKIVETPPAGGDTLWASGYGLYDKLSAPFRAFLETLTGNFQQPNFKQAAVGRFEIFSGPRGAPENVGDDLHAVHPIVRTNPVTGWKSVFAIGTHFKTVNGLRPKESDVIRDTLLDTLNRSPEIQVRYKWNKNDVAVWDNRSTFHTAIYDTFFIDAIRTGVRAVGIGERPYFDAESKSRTEALVERGELPEAALKFLL
jgi:alpha-ketoglutarate-dependent taurine dioxygenase